RRGLFLPEELADVIGGELATEGLLGEDPVRRAATLLSAVPPAGDDWIAVHMLESAMYMRHQLLRDSDWASMAHSLELRVPFVDVRLHDQVAALGFAPARQGGKAAVAAAAAAEIPAAVGRRPKTGFSIPMAQALGDGDAQRFRGGLGARSLALSVLAEFGVRILPSG